MRHRSQFQTDTLPKPGIDRATDQSVLAQLAKLKTMSVNELKAKWKELFHTTAPNNSRQFLELRIGYRIQELSYGGLSKHTRRNLDALADEIEGKTIRKAMAEDPRNPMPGTRLIREWNGTEHVVTILQDGYEWETRKFKSLSAIAKAITGTTWNGFRFFGLSSKRGAA
jgi:hypothetical protein